MSVLCALGNLLWFVTFVALTGVLTGVSAAFRLVEVTITFVNPIVIFMLRVSNRFILFAICLSARITYQAYKGMCTAARLTTTATTTKTTTSSKAARMEINLRAPVVPYSRSQIPNQVRETTIPVTPVDDIVSASASGSVEPSDGVEYESEYGI